MVVLWWFFENFLIFLNQAALGYLMSFMIFRVISEKFVFLSTSVF